ncbi:ubiquitin carboxyl-terminal hydrolase 12 [Phtheirospermum japonicum]|uniref:Ubiquitin carboxyl-terminal hydrolase 12 n=1 Tax=Phtheirospermum japonicum TaxID=374723 RepID=A0A830CSI0_9LAMI|nr:ubiquitin carboxyl-terminal hydrolase 12 [Phtheirospermum japonicum]
MADPHTLPANWEVSASFSICVFNHIFGNYHYALGRTHRFHAMKTEWGFSNFISKKDLTNPSNGFLIDGDSCVFGAEVLANENEAVNEYVCLTNVNVPYKQEIKISNFSSLKGGWFSDNTKTFVKCRSISVFLNGDGEATGRSLSIFLNHDASNERVKATYYLCLKSQVSDEHNVRKHGSCWFTHSGSNSWGWLSFMDHASLNDPTKGYIVNDCVHLEIELSVEAVATI